MRVEELMEVLEGLPPHAEVRLAQQPNWPFEYSIGDIAELVTDDGFVVYLGEGQQLGYLSGEAAESLGWK
ncbi:hypothetical protein [Paraburkholderia sp. MM5477-R1]|uniref:hypothetical protein n=1 Tax=Paraburkholderia sp. MM5477-R1 TaxID=2991062 RepID=UPI003D212CA3